MSIIWAFLTDYWRDALQIALLFAFIYLVMYQLRSSRGSMVLAGFLMLLFLIYGLSKLLNFNVLSNILKLIVDSLVLMLVIIFQPELRRMLAQLGSIAWTRNRRRRELIGEIVNAVQDMAKRKCGALIVVECKEKLQPLIDDAIPLDAKVNSLLLESVFYPKSPLHDGAVIIRNDRVVAARAVLPLSGSEAISKQLGTRHRAALGIAEECDAVAVVVSEESGSVSIAHDGKLYRDLTAQGLRRMLDALVVQKGAGEFDETVRRLNEDDETLADLPGTDESEIGGDR